MATPNVWQIIKADAEHLNNGDSVLTDLAGKQVVSTLTSRKVSHIMRPKLPEIDLRLTEIKKNTLTGNVLKMDNKFIYAQSKEGLWIDTTYIKFLPTPKKGDNTTLYVLGFIAILYAVS